MISKDQVEQFHREGYLIVPGLDPDLLEPLRRASAAKVKAWSQLPRAEASDRYWVHFQPGVDNPTFMTYMASDLLLGTVKDLIGDNLIWNALFCLLGSHSRGAWARVWHRDGMERYSNPEEEVAVLMKRQRHVQWNCPLYPGDNCLQVVPGSHRRPLTKEEIETLKADPNADMPNQVVVELAVGEAVFYNHLLLHRGVYMEGQQRETLHGHIMAVEQEWETPHVARGADYLFKPGYLEQTPPQLRPMFQNTIDYLNQIKQGKIGTEAGMGSREYVEFVARADVLSA